MPSSFEQSTFMRLMDVDLYQVRYRILFLLAIACLIGYFHSWSMGFGFIFVVSFFWLGHYATKQRTVFDEGFMGDRGFGAHDDSLI